MLDEYDLICSLGGSCATAKQLKMAGLRREALPFDWLFHLDNRPLELFVLFWLKLPGRI